MPLADAENGNRKTKSPARSDRLCRPHASHQTYSILKSRQHTLLAAHFFGQPIKK